MPVGERGARVLRAFDAPAHRYGPGHRGVDLPARVGAEVRSASAGRVTYAGLLAGRPVVAVRWERYQVAYEPVRAAVRVGARVRPGDILGTVAAGTHCGGRPCVHWGVRENGRYLNPLPLVTARVRLLPLRAREPVSVLPLPQAGAQAGPATRPEGLAETTSDTGDHRRTWWGAGAAALAAAGTAVRRRRATPGGR